jgi:hypothetical protein
MVKSVPGVSMMLTGARCVGAWMVIRSRSGSISPSWPTRRPFTS